VLNKIWAGFILIAILSGAIQTLWLGDSLIFGQMVKALFDAAKSGFEISLSLTGMMTLWLGLLKIGEAAGLIRGLSRVLSPLFYRIFPEIPKGHPALGNMTMNIAANMLGLDNAATPLGLKAMQSLQELNPEPDQASNAQILFLVINTASLSIFPMAVFIYRAQMGALDPTDVFIPILLATYSSTLAGFLLVAWIQRIRVFDPVVLLYIGGLSAAVGGLAMWFMHLPTAAMQAQSSLLSSVAILFTVALMVGGGLLKRVAVFDAFIEGAKEGFSTAVRIIPYLVAMMAAIALLRTSGIIDLLMGAVHNLVVLTGYDPRWVEGIPTGIMRVLSGSGARAMMIETMQTHGADSFAGRLVSVIQGSTETTFYILAVYCGSVGIKNIRYALACGLFADLMGFIAAVAMTYWFFG
jgi:spore maturation protein SpmA